MVHVLIYLLWLKPKPLRISCHGEPLIGINLMTVKCTGAEFLRSYNDKAWWFLCGQRHGNGGD